MSKKIKVPADFKGELALPCLNETLAANRVVILSEEDYQLPEVQLAINKGLILDVVEESPPAKKEPVEELVEEETTVDLLDDVTAEAAQGTETNMGTWDPVTKTILDKDASARKTMEIMKGTKASSKEVEFIDEDPVPKKAVKKSRRKTTKKRSSTSKKKSLSKVAKEIANVAEKSRKSIKAVGSERTETTADEVPDPGFVLANDGQDIGFVDKEQIEQRRRKHPILSKRNSQQNNEEVE